MTTGQALVRTVAFISTSSISLFGLFSSGSSVSRSASKASNVNTLGLLRRGIDVRSSEPITRSAKKRQRTGGNNLVATSLVLVQRTPPSRDTRNSPI